MRETLSEARLLYKNCYYPKTCSSLITHVSCIDIHWHCVHFYYYFIYCIYWVASDFD